MQTTEDPLAVPLHDKAAVLLDWTSRLVAHPVVQHATASLLQVHENKY